MRTTIVRCSHCGAALNLPESAGAGMAACRACGGQSHVWLLPALFRGQNARAGQPLLEEGQSSCMNHPQKRAVTVCDNCGKFLCALCDIDWNGEHLCTNCIEHRKNADEEGALRTEYIHYDRIALLIACVAIPAMAIGGLIAPVALYIAWRYWKVPWRPVPHRKWTMVAAVLVANLVFVTWVGFVVFTVINL